MAARRPIVFSNGKYQQLQAADTLINFSLTSGICQGRLSLSSTVPVPMSDLTTSSSIYFLPYNGNQMTLYNGTNWDLFTFPAVSINSASGSGTYDIFAYNNSGTLTLAQVAWTNATTRATALATLNGILVSSSDSTRRYLGTYTVVSSVVSDTLKNRNIWNYYNRALRKIKVTDSTLSWTYGTATWRVANNNSANVANVVVGWQDSYIDLRLSVFSVPDSTNLQLGSNGLGYDSLTATPISDLAGRFGAQGMQDSGAATLIHATDIGQHYYAWLEYVETAGVGLTSYGGLSAGRVQSGIVGVIHN